jgi:hypothetical protein
VSGVSPAAGQKNGQSNRKGNFGNVSYEHRLWPRASSLIVEETLTLCFTRRGGVYPRPKTTAITATGGDKPRPFETVLSDYTAWSPHIIEGGYLLIHDIFSDPTQGGQAPYRVYQRAVDSGLFREVAIVKTLGVLRRL